VKDERTGALEIRKRLIEEKAELTYRIDVLVSEDNERAQTQIDLLEQLQK
jgi:hypothetical protein